MNEITRENQLIEPTEFSRPEVGAGKPLLSLNPVTLVILVVFLVLTTAALFMFNARAVRFDFTPAVESLEITRGLPTYLLGERYLMLQGEYDILASLDGYETFETTIEVTEEPDQDYAFALTKLPGIVEISARFKGEEISSAEVFIDQELVGVTPVTIEEVAAGLRDLYIVHPRFLPYQTEIDVAGRRQKQTETITLSPAWATVELHSLPIGASILVDEEVVGTTPAQVEILQGERKFRLKLSGYKSWETLLEIVAEENQKIEEVLLIKSDGKLNISSQPDGVNITISGQYQGQTPLSLALAPADNYELIATRAGFESQTRRLSIEPEEDQSLNLKLKAVVGLVKLNVAPLGGALFIDGQAYGDPDQTLELTARSHTIRVDLPGYASYEAEIIPQPGFSQQLNITLQTEEAARVSAIPQRISTAQGDVMRLIIPGKLKMGAGRREPGRRSNEVEKEVELTRSFYLGEQEISNKTFRQFDPGHDSGVLGRALLSEEDRPVVNVSWDKAIRFSNWLSEKDNLSPAYESRDGQWQLKQPLTTGYRLPTEAEWAWAARYAGTDQPTRFPWGDNMPPVDGSGNFADDSAVNMVPYNIHGYNDSYRGPAPSGSYSANAFGIFDLAGNVSEWMHDFYSIELNRELLTDPLGPDSGDYHAIRGSNYTHGRFSELRWTFRDYGSDPRPDVGFRLARFLE